MHIFSLTPTFAISESDSNALEKQDLIATPVLDYSENKENVSNIAKEDNNNTSQYKKEEVDILINSKDIEDKNIENKDMKDKDSELTQITPLDNSNLNNIDKDIATIDKGEINKEIKLNTAYSLNSDTTLKSLGFYSKNISLKENFSPDAKEYTAIVSGNDTTFRIYGNCISANSNLSVINVYFNNDLVVENAKGMPDKTFTLKKDVNNQLKIEVIAESGDKDYYIVNIKRAGSSDTALNLMAFYSGNVTLDNPYSPDIKNYIGKVKGTDTSVRTNQYGGNRIETRDPYATITLYFNNELIFENVRTVPQKTFDLIKGISNEMKIVVTSENGSKDTYNLILEREGYNNTNLNSIAFYSGNVTLNTQFSPDIKNYIGQVKDGHTSVTTNQYGGNRIETKDPYATITLYFNDELIFENVRTVPQRRFDLIKDSENIMKIVVTAESGEQDTYTISFKREGYNNTLLNSIAFYSGNITLDTPFSPDIKNYKATLKEGHTSFATNQYGANRIEVKDSYATMDIYFNKELIFENVKTVPQKTFSLVKGIHNIMEIVVTAENGEQDTYTLTFEREGYNDTTLNSISFYSGNVNLDNDFSKEIKNYKATLKEGDTSFKTNQYGPNRIEVKDPYATMDIYFNNELIFKNVNTVPQHTFELVKGITNTMDIVVTAESGNKDTYTLKFERELDSSVNIKDVVIDKASLDLIEDTINATMYSWQDISLSSLILEDSWADYKAVLNDNKEIEVNESFDLDKGDNKLEIEVISNNGTKKVYPLSFERSDNTSPTVSYTVDNNKWTNKDVLISISATDDSGIRYIELPNGDKVYSNNAQFYANQNGTYTFKVYDEFLNESIEIIEIQNIDANAPTLNLKASTNELTNSNVDILFEANDNIEIDHIILPDGSITKETNSSYTAYKDGTYTFTAVDVSGNETKKQIYLNNIDSENPILSIEMSTTNWTNKDLLLNISAMSNKGIKHIILPNGNKVENSSASYKVKENGTYIISTESLGGNITTEKVVVSNIDTKSPVVKITASTTKLTNSDVNITIDANDNSGISYILLPNGEKIYKSKYNYSAATNGKYSFTIVDLAGNKSTKSIEIKNIDKNPPVIENKEDVIEISNDTITLDLSTVTSSSGIYKVILPNGEEIVNPKEDKITYKVKYNDIYTFKIVDKAGNSTDVNIEASNLKDKIELPDTSGFMSFMLSLSVISLLYGTALVFKNSKNIKK